MQNDVSFEQWINLASKSWYTLLRDYDKKQWFQLLSIMPMRGSCIKTSDFTWNLSGATSFWMSTSVWESLLNAKNVNFCSCSYVSLTWVSRKKMKKYVFDYFSAFLFFGPCKRMCMHLLVKIHNTCLPSLTIHQLP